MKCKTPIKSKKFNGSYFLSFRFLILILKIYSYNLANKKGDSADSPSVAVLTGICNAITDIIQQIIVLLNKNLHLVLNQQVISKLNLECSLGKQITHPPFQKVFI